MTSTILHNTLTDASFKILSGTNFILSLQTWKGHASWRIVFYARKRFMLLERSVLNVMLNCQIRTNLLKTDRTLQLRKRSGNKEFKRNCSGIHVLDSSFKMVSTQGDMSWNTTEMIQGVSPYASNSHLLHQWLPVIAQ